MCCLCLASRPSDYPFAWYIGIPIEKATKTHFLFILLYGFDFFSLDFAPSGAKCREKGWAASKARAERQTHFEV